MLMPDEKILGLIYILLLFLSLPVSVGHTLTKEEEKFIDEWNNHNIRICDEFAQKHIPEWMDVNKNRFITFIYTLRQDNNAIACLLGDVDGKNYFYFTASPTEGGIAARLKMTEDLIIIPPFIAQKLKSQTTLDPERGKAACKVAEKEKAKTARSFMDSRSYKQGQHSHAPREAQHCTGRSRISVRAISSRKK